MSRGLTEKGVAYLVTAFVGLAGLMLVAGAVMVPLVVAASMGQGVQAEEVARMLREDLDLDGLEVTQAGTEVTLAGRVGTLWEKTEAINRTLEIEGVETVASEIVIPAVEDDAEIASDVGDVIRTYRHITILDYVGGGVEDGIVTLTGSVTPDRDKVGELFERVAKIRGVQDVRLEILVQSNSRRDRDLRGLIVRRVLRHPTLSHYTLGGGIPPFRILVHESIVTLVGAVRSGAESRLIESIARQAFEVDDVVNHLQYPQ